jgi:Polysaccharide lyase
VTVNHSEQRIVADPDNVPQEVVFETKELPPGEWNDFVYQIKWSYHKDGFVNAWLNGKPMIRYRGPVGYNDEIGPTFNFGLYRDGTDKTYTVYFDEYRRGKSFSEVDPSK